MEGDTTYRAKLELLPKPVAVIRNGVCIYANAAFLKLFGHDRIKKLKRVPFRKLAWKPYRERLDEHLKMMESNALPLGKTSRVKLSLKKTKNRRFVAIMKTQRVRFEGDEAVLFTLRTKENSTLKWLLLSSPWKLYFCIAFLAISYLLPPIVLLKLNVNNAPKTYISENAPSVVVDNILREIFPDDQVLILLFEGRMELYSDDFLKRFDRLTQDLKADALVDDVISVTTQDHIAGDQDGFLVEPLVNLKTANETSAYERQQRLIADRFAKKRLVAADGAALSMVVIPAGDANSLQRMSFQERVLDIVEQAGMMTPLTAVAGPIATDVAQFNSMLRDNMIFIPATVLIGLLFVWWLYRHWFAVLLTMVAIGIVTTSTVAFYVVFDRPFTLISSIIAPLLSALTTATLVHLFNALHYASQRGLTGKERVEKALSEVRRPAIFTALTTAAGLASLAASPIPPVKDFGLIAAAGVALICVIVIGIMPTIFAYWDYAPWQNKRGGLKWMDLMVRKIMHVGIRYPVHIIATIVLLCIVSIPQIWNVESESNLQEFFLPDHPLRAATSRVEEKLIGTTPVDILFTGEARDDLKKPEVLKMIRDFQVWAEGLPEVDGSISHADFIEEMHWGFNAEQARSRTIPDDRRLVSQYLFVYDGEDIYDFVDREFKVSRVNLNLNVHGANAIGDVIDKVQGYLETHVGDGLSWDIGGFGRIFAEQAELLVDGQVLSLWMAIGLICFLMLLLWRSFSATVLCMIPNLSPILLIFIIMGTMGIWLDVATVMIAGVAVGIAVDDTIHVYHGFKKRIESGAMPVVALARTFKQAGRAVTTTTIILCAQFMILMSSQFIPTTHFGLLTSVGLLSALVFDLLLMPAMLILIYQKGARP